MKHTYRIHPQNYDVSRTERFYSRMAKKGWKLEKRGLYLSRFRKSPPENLLCRIELSSSEGMPEEQIALYEEAGWTFSACCQFVNVFFAPADSGAPEFYSDPAQQAATYTALKKSYRNNFLGFLLYTICYTILILLGGYQGSAGRFTAAIHISFLTNPFGMIALLFLFFVLWYGQLRAVICLHVVCRRLKAGKAFDHVHTLCPVLRWTSYLLGILLAVLAALGIWEYASSRSYPMPSEADGPYLLLSDLGYTGERTYALREENTSSVSHGSSPVTAWWDTQEFIRQKDGTDAALYQKIFRVSSTEKARSLVPVMMETSTFRMEFTPVEVEGLDEAYVNDLDIIAVKDNYICSATRILPDSDDPSSLLEAFADLFSE